jgi:hypothetical protein
VIVILSIKLKYHQDEPSRSTFMQSNKKIHSQQKSNYKVLLAIGTIFLLLPFLFPSASGDDPTAFMLILFPLVGVILLFFGANMRKSFLHFGRTPLIPLPEIGQVGGQVGGRIELNQYYAQHDLLVTLNCMNKYTTNDSDNSDTLHYQVLWKEQIKPLYYKCSTGSSIDFCFDVPAGQYTKDTYKGSGSVYWEVCIEGLMDGVKFDRSWVVPVEEGNKLSSIVITDRHKKISANSINKKAEVSIDQQINTKKTFNGLNIVSEQGRNLLTCFLFLLMGAIFSIIGCFLILQYNLEIILFSLLFLIAGCILLCYGVFLIGRELECKISGTTVLTQRRLFGRLMSTNKGTLTSPEQLSLEVTILRIHNGKSIETMALYANVNSPVSKKIKLVEGIEGRSAGEAMKKKIVTALFRKK